MWANLDVQQLQDGIETLLKQFRRLPRDVKAMEAAKLLEAKMKEFKESIPLFLDLKNEALRER